MSKFIKHTSFVPILVVLICAVNANAQKRQAAPRKIDERTTSFIFLLEDGAWKLDDIYTFRGTYSQAESLNQYLLEK